MMLWLLFCGFGLYHLQYGDTPAGERPSIASFAAQLAGGWMYALITLLAIFLLVSQAPIGPGMPSVGEEGTRSFGSVLAYLFSEPERGDAIHYRGRDQVRIGRIIGLPGETVAIADGTIEINGKPLSVASRVKALSTQSRAPITVPADAVFVARERIVGEDSVWTVVPRAKIVGLVLVAWRSTLDIATVARGLLAHPDELEGDAFSR